MRMNGDEDTTRRGFLTWGVWTALGVLAAAAAWPVARLAARPPRPKRVVFVHAAALDDLPEDGVRKVELSLHGGERPDARVFIRRGPDGALTAFSAVCTHLGCLVNWDPFKRQFVCPCHGGKYDMDGTVTSGPPPGPLGRLPVRVEGDSVLVGFEE